MKQFTIFTSILFLSLSLCGVVASSSAEYSRPDTVAIGASGGVGEVTLSWPHPIENTDHSSLHNLQEYKIYYGSTSDEFVDLLRDTDGVGANLTEFPIEEGINTRTIYNFGTTTFNDDGVEVVMSNLESNEL
jgi:hypothetical protein